MTTQVPPQYQGMVAAAAAQLGIPASVVAEQIFLESSWNPNTTSATGAKGLTQFEPGTWSEFGAGGDPYNAQDSMNAYVRYMKSLLNGQGGNLQRALAAYNAGPGNINAGLGYANTVMSRAGSSQSTAVAPSGGSGGIGSFSPLSPYGATGGPSPVLDSATLAASYGYSAALLNSDTELKTLFSKAVSGGWTAEKFTAELQNTKWFQNHSDTSRKFVAQGTIDPATQSQNIMQQTVSIQTAGSKMGAHIDDATARSLAVTSLQSGWNTDQLNRAIAGYIQWDQYGHLGGAAGDEEMSLRQLANKNGASIADTWILDAVRQVNMGKSSMENFQGQIRTMAARQYPAYADQIQKGINLEDLASPYAQELQKILEQGPEASVLTTPLMQKALQYVDPTSGKPGPMPLWQFQDVLKKDPKWMGTQNAQDSLIGAGHQVLKDFGFQF